MKSIPSLRAVRPAPEPLGLYFRDLQKHMMKHRKRLDALRVSLGNLVDLKSVHTHSSLPGTRAAREGRISGSL